MASPCHAFLGSAGYLALQIVLALNACFAPCLESSSSAPPSGLSLYIEKLIHRQSRFGPAPWQASDVFLLRNPPRCLPFRARVHSALAPICPRSSERRCCVCSSLCFPYLCLERNAFTQSGLQKRVLNKYEREHSSLHLFEASLLINGLSKTLSKVHF